jgi:hypothetical protein
MDKELRDRLFAAAVAAGLISHETPLGTVEDVLRGLLKRHEAFMRADLRPDLRQRDPSSSTRDTS